MKYTFSEKEVTESSSACSDASAAERRPAGRGLARSLSVLVVLAVVAGAWLVWQRRKAPATPPMAAGTDGPEEKQVRVAEPKVAVSKDRIMEYLTPSEAEMQQLYGYVMAAPFVTENLQYRSRLNDTAFVYVATNDIVNAFSGRQIVEKDGEKGLSFHIVFCGGAARYARLVGLAAALQDAGHKDMLKRFVAAMPRSFCGRCSVDGCVKFIVDNGLGEAIADDAIRQKAMSYSCGTIVSVLAHECGHQALGHLLAFSEKQNLEIDRNQEREADSFASSVISDCPFGEYIFAGTLFWHYAVAMQSDGAAGAGSNHPLSKERFENFVRSNAVKAAAMGITLDK